MEQPFGLAPFRFDKYIEILNINISEIVSQFNKFLLSKYDVLSLQNGNNLIISGNLLLNTLSSHINLLKNTLGDCKDFLTDMEEELTTTPKEEPYVYHSKNGMLSYP